MPPVRPGGLDETNDDAVMPPLSDFGQRFVDAYDAWRRVEDSVVQYCSAECLVDDGSNYYDVNDE